MKKYNVIISALLLNFFSIAQLIVPDYSNAFKKEFSFHPQYIQQNQIKKVIFEILDKKDFQVPVDKNLVEHYEFTNNGHLSRFYYTDILRAVEKEVTVPPVYKGKKRIKKGYTYLANEYVYDTISITHLFNDANKILMKRYHSGGGVYDTRYYNYDSSLHLVKENRYKETNVSISKNDFILGNQVLISTDSMRVISYGENQTKVIYYNSEHRPYKEQIILRKEGRVVGISESYVAASWIRQDQAFTYNEKGQLITALFTGNANVSFTYKHTYEYDKNGWLLTDKHYKNDVLLSETSFVNDLNSSLVNSIVIRDFPNRSIRIIKLKYAYFDCIQVKNK